MIRNMFLRLLSLEWFGLVIAAIVAALGYGAWLTPGVSSRFGIALLMIAGALACGALFHLTMLAHVRRKYPPKGRMVVVNGMRMHVLAEGDARSKPPVVWLGGGHAAGATVQHMHQRVRNAVRSILVDRPGTGWSDTGPFPRTTAREADEVVEALAAAGEVGPFVFAGYSFGGLLSANIGRRRPDLVAKLVLLDPTPLETIVFGPRLGALQDMRRDAFNSALLRLFGVHIDLNAMRAARNPQYEQVSVTFRDRLGEALTTLKAVEISAGSQLAHFSIYRELSPEGVAACGWETVVYDGDLGDMPVYLVAPGDGEDVKSNPDVAGASEAESLRMQRFFASTRERYLATSTRSQRIYAPAGSTHQFVYEHPDFVAKTVLDIVVA